MVCKGSCKAPELSCFVVFLGNSSIYQDLPIVSEEEFLALTSSSEETMTSPEDPHEVMVARLKHEVEQRQRLVSLTILRFMHEASARE